MDTETLRRAMIIVRARDWLGTPWKHQHRLKGVGVDCVGLILAAGIEAGVLEEPGEAFHPWRGYSRTPNPRQMEKGLLQFLQPQTARPLAGDVAWLAWPEAPHLPMHLAILGPGEGQGVLSLIHSSERVGRVVEHGLTGEWPSMVNSWWRFPGV